MYVSMMRSIALAATVITYVNGANAQPTWPDGMVQQGPGDYATSGSIIFPDQNLRLLSPFSGAGIYKLDDGAVIDGADGGASLTREQTLAKITRAVTEIQSIYPQPSVFQSASMTDFVLGKVDEAIKKAVQLQAELRDNPYVKVKGFQVGFPSGITVEFEFKDAPQPLPKPPAQVSSGGDGSSGNGGSAKPKEFEIKPPAKKSRNSKS